MSDETTIKSRLLGVPLAQTGFEGTRIGDKGPGVGPSGLRLLIAIPALNEEATIAEVIRAVPVQITGVSSVELLVVNDGSTDETARLAIMAGAEVIHHTRTRGVGAAFQSAISYAIHRGVDVIVTLDADGQFDPAHIPTLIKPVLDRFADFTTASRFMDPALVPEMPSFKKWGNRFMSRLISRLIGHRFYDVSCGMRCYNRRAAVSLNLLGQFTYTHEVFMILALKHFNIVEVPLQVRGERAFGKSRVADSLWRYALNTSRIILRCYRDYHPMRFFGAIAAALAVPGLLLCIFLLVHYSLTGKFSPHKWAGFVGAALIALGLIMIHMGIIGDMLNRHRVYLEELLYRQRMSTHRDDDR
jgi:glycosyltransferase involved in cell wall biosynthesis